MLKGVQNDVVTIDIETESILSRPNPVLTLHPGYIFEPLNVISTAAVVGIVR